MRKGAFVKIRYCDLHKSVHHEEVNLGVPVSLRTRSRKTSWDEALAKFEKADSAGTTQTKKQDEPKRSSNTVR
jgi:hypothetical protein